MDDHHDHHDLDNYFLLPERTVTGSHPSLSSAPTSTSYPPLRLPLRALAAPTLTWARAERHLAHALRRISAWRLRAGGRTVSPRTPPHCFRQSVYVELAHENLHVLRTNHGGTGTGTVPVAQGGHRPPPSVYLAHLPIPYAVFERAWSRHSTKDRYGSQSLDFWRHRQDYSRLRGEGEGEGDLMQKARIGGGRLDDDRQTEWVHQRQADAGGSEMQVDIQVRLYDDDDNDDDGDHGAPRWHSVLICRNFCWPETDAECNDLSHATGIVYAHPTFNHPTTIHGYSS